MSGIFRFFAKPPVSGFVALLLLIGALFALRLYTEISDTIFWLALAGLVALWAALSGLWWFLQRRKRARFSAEAAPPPDPSAAMVGDEQRKLQGKFTDAMRQLSTLRVKGRRGGSRYLYELPWYIFIGPPGGGKTGALKNCGLDFPLRREGGPIDIEGGGGTANCNWVITDEAVFIDTAGRYTTRSSNETVDGAAWRNFLGLLSRHRPREPINGVIVAIGLTDLMGGDGAALARNAEAVRERLKELYEETKARIPVYVIFTKADLLVGFNETFQAMRAEERRQVWGATFTGESEAEMRAALDGFGGEFDALVARLGEYQLRRLHEERDTLVRGKIFSFSAQFSSIKPAIEQFLRRAFEPNRFGDPAWLRGVYFTSATQFGQPIDRLMEAMARDFGVERKAVALTPPGAGRSYFLEHLLSKVVFPEAGLVTRTVRRGPPYARYAAIAACAVAAGLAGVGVMRMQAYNAAQAKAFEASIGDYNAALANEETAFIDTGDPRPILPALDIRRDEWMRLRDVTPPRKAPA